MLILWMKYLGEWRGMWRPKNRLEVRGPKSEAIAPSRFELNFFNPKTHQQPPEKMNRFTGFVKKEFLHIIRDKRTMLILFGIPIVQILLFGYVLTNEINDANIAILDHSKDETTARITNK